ncbi:hypothetical protein MAM1_0308c09512 [Mucor ambiguus]|uniref:Uncharacterized protein n=1 Tax=Mucor ambiguus TaxID=91626 RepID=A0A0C9MR78_9FUNG|nr:hypothetical protein MAM1_0308c09512 [Mucor ambiguus]
MLSFACIEQLRLDLDAAGKQRDTERLNELEIEMIRADLKTVTMYNRLILCLDAGLVHNTYDNGDINTPADMDPMRAIWINLCTPPDTPSSVASQSGTLFEWKSRASAIRSTVAIETTIKLLGHVNMPFNFATNVSLEDKNECDAVDSKADDSNSTANVVEGKVINCHAKQEATDDDALLQLQNTAKFVYL